MISLICMSRTTIREQVLLNACRRIQQTAFVRPTEQDLFEGALEGMTAKLRTKYGDHYSAYENATQQQRNRDHLDNRLVGLGVSLVPLGQAQGVQLFPLPGSPALKAGVRYGDLLLKIEGDDATGLSLSEISKKLEGPVGTKVTLHVRRADADHETGTEAEATVTRAQMHLPSVFGDRLDRDGNWCYTLETAPDIGYLAVNKTFSDSTPLEVAKVLAELNKSQDVRGVLLDLRGNPGGYLNAAVGVCNLFLNEGVIVTTKQRYVSDTITARNAAIWDKPVVVLMDAMSASAAEIVAACLQDHDIAVVVGTRSYGKGTVQEMIKLPLNMGTVRLTKSEYFRPSEKNINRGNKGDDDEWGVSPNDGYALELSDRQSVVTYRIRNLRTIIPGEEELGRQIDRLVAQVKAGGLETGDAAQMQLDDGGLETGDAALMQLGGGPALEWPSEETGTPDPAKTPFVPKGTAPYYDPQLDLAVEY
ncbi:MAG: S41 family peptidase, partial [Planctomycetaceae bacterium]|nr:S41 family peptidase [Planctomycetaceae bacterium]